MTLATLVEQLLPGVRVIPPPAPPPSSARAANGLLRLAFPRNFRPNTPQRRAREILLEGGFRFFIVGAGRRGSKTQFDGATFSDFIVRDITDKTTGSGRWTGRPADPWARGEGKDPEPFLRYFVLSPTHGLNDEPKIALRKYLGHVKDKVPGLIVSQKDHPSEWWLEAGVRIDFLSGDTPNMNVSHGYDGGWMGEAAKCKPAVWGNIRPALSDKQGWCLFDTTPEGHNWLWREVWARANREAAELVATLEGCSVEDVLDPEFGGYTWTTAENDSLPHLKREMEIARRQLPDAVFRREYLGSWDAFEGQCFDLQTQHAAKWQGGRHLRVQAGIDLGNVGRTSHRTSFTVWVEDYAHDWWDARTESGADMLPFGDNAWALRTRGDRTTWANRLWAALYEIAGDGWRRVPVFVPADRPDVKRVFGEYGFNVEEAYQEHEAAVTWFQVAFKNARVKIGSDVLWNCLVGIHYPERGKASRKLWVDENDDEWDGARYGLTPQIRDGEMPTRAPLSAMGWKAR